MRLAAAVGLLAIASRDATRATSPRRSNPTIPVVLGQINVENVSPQAWLERGGLGDHRDTYGGELVYAGIDVECVSWLDVTSRTPR